MRARSGLIRKYAYVCGLAIIALTIMALDCGGDGDGGSLTDLSGQYTWFQEGHWLGEDHPSEELAFTIVRQDNGFYVGGGCIVPSPFGKFDGHLGDDGTFTYRCRFVALTNLPEIVFIGEATGSTTITGRDWGGTLVGTDDLGPIDVSFAAVKTFLTEDENDFLTEDEMDALLGRPCIRCEGTGNHKEHPREVAGGPILVGSLVGRLEVLWGCLGRCRIRKPPNC